MTEETIEDHFGISDERALEIKKAIIPLDHDSSSSVADAVFDICKDENEIRYVISHLSSFGFKMAYRAYMAEKKLGEQLWRTI